MKTFTIFCLLLFIFVQLAHSRLYFETKLSINDERFIEIHEPGVYIVHLKREETKNKPIILTCSSGEESVDLNLTFTGFDAKEVRLPADQINKVGPKQLELKLEQPLKTTFTGRYNCSALYKDGRYETISWYVYFWPDNGELFLQCPLFGQIPKCIVFYKVKIPFKIPCKTLHPDVKVFDQTEKTGNFKYSPEIGFSGVLNDQKKEFECKAFYDGKSASQKYELNRRSFSTKISIIPPKGIDVVPINSINAILVKKNQALNLTCVAPVGCNDINYDIKFVTNLTDKYKNVVNQPDRSKCLVNYNDMYDFSRSILIETVTRNETSVQCEINFGPDFKTTSPNYMIFFSDNSFIRHEPKSALSVDYTGVTEHSSFLTINVYFEASEPFNIEWYLNKQKINTGESQAAAADKYTAPCIHYSLFKQHCYLFIDNYNNKDVGDYSAFIYLKDNEKVNLTLNTRVIKPTSPDTMFTLPKYCSQNWTCQMERTTTLQCNAQAHRVMLMFIHSLNCDSLDECYNIKSNKTYIDNLLIELYQKELIKQPMISDSSFIETMNPNKYQKIDDDDDDDERKEMTPQQFDRVETIDNGITWSIKTKFVTSGHHLIFCVARNEIGDSVTTKIIIPSELNQGKPYQVMVYDERAQDDEFVVGDKIKIEFLYNNILYDPSFYFLSKPDSCKDINVVIGSYAGSKRLVYTQVVGLEFTYLTQECNFNYSMELRVYDHPYFTSETEIKPTNPIMEYSLNVLSPIYPSFLHNNINSSVQTNNATTNKTNLVYTTTRDLKVKPDSTVILDCQSIGKPKPSIVWFKNNNLLNLTAEEKYKLENGLLKLFRTHPVDSGVYECRVSNRLGRLSRSFNLQVETMTHKMNKRQIVAIVLISIAVFILSILLAIALFYVIHQKREHNKLKKKHEDLINFLNGSGELDLEDELLINTKLENLQKLKFDDQKWEIEPTRFLIYQDRVLGSGNFGKVCLGSVSNEQIRDETQINSDPLDAENSGNRLAHRFSIKRNNRDDTNESEYNELMIPKSSRLAAVKMVKDQKVNSQNIDSLLQELKIMGFIGHHLNVVQLIGCYTSKLVTQGIAYVFVEYCPNGDLKNWLRKNKSKYSSIADTKSSLFHDLKKRLSRPASAVKAENFTFNDNDLLFFAYQIAKGMEHLARKRFLHKDLAARNILIGENFECKISDFGLADESKLSTQSYFGRVSGHMPLKWTAPEALIDLRYEANSDVWSFGIVLWEIFTLGESDPYPSILNKDFRDHMVRIKNGEDSPPLPDNGSDHIHDLMNDCWQVDPQARPTFQEIAPKIHALLPESHKQVYELLNEKFKKQCIEMNKDRVFRRDVNSQQPRNSSQSTAYTSKSPANQSATQPQNVAPTYIKITPPPPTTNQSAIPNRQSNNTTGGYLQPINSSNQNTRVDSNNTQDGYLLPSNNQSNQSAYLEPSKPPPKTNDDTYGGAYNTNKKAVQIPITVDKAGYLNQPSADTYLMPASSNRPQSNNKDFEYIDDDRSDTYLLPRQGSNMSSASTNSTYLQPTSKYTLLDKNRLAAKNYVPPPMPGENNKLSTFRTINETDV